MQVTVVDFLDGVFEDSALPEQNQPDEVQGWVQQVYQAHLLVGLQSKLLPLLLLVGLLHYSEA